MVKQKLSYHCEACGASLSKWAGQCPECSAWNTVRESVKVARPSMTPARAGNYQGFAGQAGDGAVVTLASVETQSQQRLSTSLDELDRVLGGGLVPPGGGHPRAAPQDIPGGEGLHPDLLR